MDLLLKQITEIEKLKKESSEKVSKLISLVNKDAKTLNHEKKRYMDAIKILARNLFYKLIRIFRPIYDNFREDHKLLRELTQASGTVKINNNIYICEIDTPRNYDKRQLKSIKIFLKTLSESLNSSTKKFNNKKVDFQVL